MSFKLLAVDRGLFILKLSEEAPGTNTAHEITKRLLVSNNSERAPNKTEGGQVQFFLPNFLLEGGVYLIYLLKVTKL